VQTVGIVSPGAMGSAMANALARGGVRVLATVSGRSDRTARLADRAGLELIPDLASVVRGADVVLSIVPPEVAEAVVADISEAARSQNVEPLIADLNAIAPATARRAEAIAAEANCHFVDGSISGPPPWNPGTTRLYLSGPRASELAALPFDGVETMVVGDVGAASAVKMSTASVYKGNTALLTQALLAAEWHGVLEHVLADLRLGTPELVSQVERRLANAATKSDRYIAEMHEIAASQSAAQLTPALFEAMAEVFEALSQTSLAKRHPEDLGRDLELRAVLEGLRGSRSDRGGESLA
jgi:3-hydroxyisobutyrate dehydrogenase-like beta-hydroxyacid dehydrogenase